MTTSVWLCRLSINVYTVAFSLIKINFLSMLQQLLAARTQAPLAVAYTVCYWQPSKCTVGDNFLLILSLITSDNSSCSFTCSSSSYCCCCCYCCCRVSTLFVSRVHIYVSFLSYSTLSERQRHKSLAIGLTAN